MSAPDRAYHRTPVLSTTTSARTPSHLNSYDQPGSSGRSPEVASIGRGTDGTRQPYAGHGAAQADTARREERGDASDLEGRGLVRPRLDRGEAVLRDGGEGHPLPPGAPHRRRA